MSLDQEKAYKLWEAMGIAGFSLDEIKTIVHSMAGPQAKPPRKKWTRDEESWRAYEGKKAARFERMAELYKSGETLEEIGKRFSLTRERVRQILRKGGVVRSDGGQAIKQEIKKHLKYSLRVERATERLLQHYGCTYDEMMALNDGKSVSTRGSLAMAYRNQMRHAEYLGIEWKFTFPQWVEAWENSGKIDQRGRSADSYVMGRKGDVGPYSPDNVIFITLRQNSSDSQTKLSKDGSRKARDELGLTPRMRQAYDLFISGATAADMAEKMGVVYGTAYGYFVACRNKHAEIVAGDPA